jgi:hypothetical protein
MFFAGAPYNTANFEVSAVEFMLFVFVYSVHWHFRSVWKSLVAAIALSLFIFHVSWYSAVSALIAVISAVLTFSYSGRPPSTHIYGILLVWIALPLLCISLARFYVIVHTLYPIGIALIWCVYVFLWIAGHHFLSQKKKYHVPLLIFTLAALLTFFLFRIPHLSVSLCLFFSLLYWLIRGLRSSSETGGSASSSLLSSRPPSTPYSRSPPRSF